MQLEYMSKKTRLIQQMRKNLQFTKNFRNYPISLTINFDVVIIYVENTLPAKRRNLNEQIAYRMGRGNSRTG